MLYGQNPRGLFSFKKEKRISKPLYHSWKSIIMHLPYAFQGRRMFSEIYALDALNKIISGNETPVEYQNKLKEISKSTAYQKFVAEKLQPAELASSLIGNLYTGSIFMAFLSTLSYYFNTDKEIKTKNLGF